MKIYLVGGAVRDSLLKLPIKDKDYLVVGATIDEMIKKGFRQVGNDFPVFLHPKTQDEYALARTEHKTGVGYNGFNCHFSPDVTLEDDLLRRDLTINAIAQDQAGTLYDPYNGIADLNNRILRHVSPAFIEDPLRVLRVARFAARFAAEQFTIAPETLTLMQEITASGELTMLTAERVWKEVDKALDSDSPDVFFNVLRQCGALAVLFPEIDALFGVPQSPKHHPEIDTGIHSLMVLAQASKLTTDKTVRFAALLHDLGKACTPQENWPKHPNHGELGITPIKQLCSRLKAPVLYRDLAVLASDVHTQIHDLAKQSPATIIELFNKADLWRKPERLSQLALICKADSQGRAGMERLPYPQAELLKNIFDAANVVEVKPIVDAGFKGADIRIELDRQRKLKIAAIL